MATLIQIMDGHMRFVPAHKQSDETTSYLSLVKLFVELVLISNEKGREAFLSHERIHTILAPVIHTICSLVPAQTYVSRHH
jgi:hypothetical protein